MPGSSCDNFECVKKGNKMNIAYIDKDPYEIENFKCLCCDIDEIDNVECFQDAGQRISHLFGDGFKISKIFPKA